MLWVQFTFFLKALAGLKTGVLLAAKVIALREAKFAPIELDYFLDDYTCRKANNTFL